MYFTRAELTTLVAFGAAFVILGVATLFFGAVYAAGTILLAGIAILGMYIVIAPWEWHS